MQPIGISRNRGGITPPRFFQPLASLERLEPGAQRQTHCARLARRPDDRPELPD